MNFERKRGLIEPTEADKEELRLYGGDVRGGVALVVVDDWSRGVLALPVPGKGRTHAKYLAEQIVRYISGCGFSACIRAFSQTAPGHRGQGKTYRLGFQNGGRTGWRGGSQANGRVEREIQTARGLTRTLIRSVREGAQAEVDIYGPLAQ